MSLNLRKSAPCLADEAAAFALGNVHVDARAVDVVHEELAAIFRREAVALVNEQARVRVAAAEVVAGEAILVGPLATAKVRVVGNGLDVVVDVRVQRLVGLALFLATKTRVVSSGPTA